MNEYLILVPWTGTAVTGVLYGYAAVLKARAQGQAMIIRAIHDIPEPSPEKPTLSDRARSLRGKRRDADQDDDG